VKAPSKKEAKAKKGKADAKAKKQPIPEPVEEEEVIESDDDGAEAEEEEEAGEEEEELSEERELEIGDIVEVEYKGKDVAATVISIDEEQSTVKVQIDNKRVVVPLEKVYLLEG
jgi:sRNA-binding protein